MNAVLVRTGPAVRAHSIGYVLATTATVAALFAPADLTPWFGGQPVLVALAIVLSAGLGGLGPGLTSTAVVALAAVFFLVPAASGLTAGQPVDAVQWLILVLIGVLLSGLIELLRRTRRAGREAIGAGRNEAAERAVRRGFGAALIILAAIGAIAVFSVARLREQAAWETHTERVIGTLRLVLSLETDVETVMRGYVITGDENYLLPRDATRRDLVAELLGLRELVRDNPDQQEQLDRLAPLIAERNAAAERIIELRRAQGFAAAQAVLETGQGRRMHDRVRELIAGMENTEQRLLREREARARRVGVVTRTAIIGGGGLAFGVVAVALWMMKRQFAGRRRTEAALDRANADLTTGQRAQAAMGVSHDELERRVRLRTGELSNANLALRAEIDERRRTEESLRLAKERTESLLTGMADTYHVLDREWRYTYVNAAAIRVINGLIEVPGERILGRTLWELFPFIVGTELERQYRRAMEERVLVNFEFHQVRHDTWRHYRIYPIADGVAVFTNDVSESKRAVEALRESEERFAEAFAHAPIGVALVSPDGRWLKVNQALCDLVGYTEAELLARTFQDITQTEDLALDLEQVSRLVAGEIQTYQIEKRYIHARGHSVVVLLNVSLVRDSQGRPRYFISQIQDFSRRKLAEEDLRKSQALLRMAARLSRMGAWSVELPGLTLTWAEEVRAIHEAPAGFAPTVEAAIDFFAPEARGTVTRCFEACVRDGVPYDVELPIVTAQGRRCWVRVIGEASRDAAGAIQRVQGTVQDITERRQGVEARQRQQAELRVLFDLMPAMIWFKDTENRILQINRRAADLAGKRVEEIEGRSAAEVYPRESARFYADDLAVIRAGTPKLGQIEQVTDGRGKALWVQTDKVPFCDPDGKVIGLVIMAQDVTERRRDVEALRESEARFRELAENIQEVFWVADPVDDQKTYLSPAYEKIWGRTCQSAYERPRSWLEAIRPEDRDRVVHALSAKVTQGRYDEEYRILRPDGTERWIRDRAFPVRDGGDVVKRWVGVAEDITEYRNMQEQFRQTQKMEAIGTLAGGIAHDFNNVLAAINGYTELSRMILTGNPKVRQHLGAVLEASSRATDLIRQILAFSRRQRVARRPIALGPVVDESLKLLRATLPTTIEFDIALAADAPTVLADPTQIHQILMNLGTNAWHAMKDRPGRLTVRLDKCFLDAAEGTAQPWQASGVYARLSVSDTGCGMDEATRRRIFEPFFTTKPPGEGTGLGLAVVHGIMESHDGIMTVRSQPGEGTTFVLDFPEHAGEPVATVREGTEVPRGRGERILLVDDEELLAQLGGQTLTALDYEVAVTTRPEEALAWVRAEPARFALVITDQTMPGMTGLALADLLQQIRPGLPIILTTGFSSTLTDAQLAAAGIRQLLLKPTTLNSLGAAVRAALSTASPT